MCLRPSQASQLTNCEMLNIISIILLIQCATDVLGSRRANIQLAFGVMTYQKVDRNAEQTFQDFQRLLSIIHDQSNHVYVLHTDVKSDGSLHNMVDGYCAQRHDNCHTIPSRNVGWAGLSTGEMMLALMQDANEVNWLGHGRDWEYFVLIGHESVPLASLDYMEEYFSHQKKGTNFINCWRVDGYDFFGQWEDNMWRLQGIVVEDFQGGLLEHFEGHQRQPLTGVEFYKSIQLVVLSREFIRYAVYGMDTKLIMLYLANVKTSDEMLLPTLLQHNKTLASTATCDTTLHYTHWIRPGGSWHPEYLTLEHLPRLLNVTHNQLFARKFEEQLSSSLLTVWTRIRHEHLQVFPVDQSLGLNTPLLQQPDVVNSLCWVMGDILQYMRALKLHDQTEASVQQLMASEEWFTHFYDSTLGTSTSTDDSAVVAAADDKEVLVKHECVKSTEENICSCLEQGSRNMTLNVSPAAVLGLLDRIRSEKDSLLSAKALREMREYWEYTQQRRAEQEQQQLRQQQQLREQEELLALLIRRKNLYVDLRVRGNAPNNNNNMDNNGDNEEATETKEEDVEFAAPALSSSAEAIPAILTNNDDPREHSKRDEDMHSAATTSDDSDNDNDNDGKDRARPSLTLSHQQHKQHLQLQYHHINTLDHLLLPSVEQEQLLILQQKLLQQASHKSNDDDDKEDTGDATTTPATTTADTLSTSTSTAAETGAQSQAGETLGGVGYAGYQGYKGFGKRVIQTFPQPLPYNQRKKLEKIQQDKKSGKLPQQSSPTHEL